MLNRHNAPIDAKLQLGSLGVKFKNTKADSGDGTIKMDASKSVEEDRTNALSG